MRKSYGRRADQRKARAEGDAAPTEKDDARFTLYAAPTVDTLDTSGDAPYRPDLTAVRSEDDPSRASSSSRSFRSSSHASPARKQRALASLVQYPPSESPARSFRKAQKLPPRPAVRSKKKKRTPRDFQHEEDAMTVTTRTIDLKTRMAFEPIHPVSIKEWHFIAKHAAEVRRTQNMEKKLSPSLQHLQLLHKMQSISSIRQLHFSPSVGLDSDVFVPWDEDLQQHDAPKRRKKLKRDGRYRSIDPLKAATAALPAHAPLLSNRKHRLPMRADVGFSNPSEKEILLKQQEIKQETEWEEASPRLVVLVTSDDIGTTVHEHSPANVSPEHLEFNGGGLDGIPLAGRELMMAKQRNYRLWKEDAENLPKFKPNRTSMLAPPLDSTYSSTLGWRPRPFYDKPPGILHCLACPLEVNFDIGNIEPLVGSLALYSLPTDSDYKGVYGKMSEEFYFPVGNWKGHVKLEAARTVRGAMDLEMIDAWYGRKHKALFSYDPLTIDWKRLSLHVVLQIFKVPHENSTGPYLAKASKKHAGKNVDPKGRGIGSRIKGSVGKKLGKPPSGGMDASDVGLAQSRSSATFDAVGTQFLTPLCFGVMPLYPHNIAETLDESVEEGINSLDEAKLSWPNGATEEIRLYAAPSFMSQEDFCTCVTTVALSGEAEMDPLLNRSRSPNAEDNDTSGRALDISGMTESDAEDNVDITSNASSTSPPNVAKTSSSTSSRGDTSSMRSRRRIFSRRASDRPETNPSSNEGLARLDRVAGSATLFISTVGKDLTQSMLNTPAELLDFQPEKGHHSLPRLLVDVSGDCAIMMNPSASQVSTDSSAQGYEAGRKRSDLVRLPLASNPSGYADASEVRELMHLPPREKQYELDAPGSFRSCINLLYLYPVLLKSNIETESNEEGKTRGRNARQAKKESVGYSVRVQLVRNTVYIDKVTGEEGTSQMTLDSFYNPAPWGGSQMLQAMYTKTNVGGNGKHQQPDVAHEGIPLRDEIKMRLPMVLDGSYFLQFTLFSVKPNDSGGTDNIDAVALSMDALAETTIPLSSSSNREAKTGARITTVIPNGCHRIKLGDFQLQMETRLVSSVHVCDPTVATVLRDFPIIGDGHDEMSSGKVKDLALSVTQGSTGKLSAGESKVPFHELFATATGNALFPYFPILVYLHLYNLANTPSHPDFLRLTTSSSTRNRENDNSGNKDTADPGIQFAMDNVISLLEILGRLRQKLVTETGSSRSHAQEDVFVKNFIDTFEETALRLGDPGDSESTAERSRSSLSLATPQKNPAPGDDDSDDENGADDGTVVTLKRKDYAHSKSLSSFDASGAPFSRFVFGASKTDRMRVEAELFHEGNSFTQLFDDDETVATSLQHRSGVEKIEDASVGRELSPRRSRSIEDNSLHAVDSDDSLLVRSPSKPIKPKGKVAHERGLAESAFARRVKTAAQVMIAPCMAPSMSAVLTAGTSNSPPTSITERDQLKIQMRSAVNSALSTAAKNEKEEVDERTQESEGIRAYPGSDVEEDSISESFMHLELGTGESVLRCIQHVRVLSLTTTDLTESQEGDICPTLYVYEVILMLWLRAWKNLNEKASGDFGGETSKTYSDFFHSSKMGATDSESEPFFSFYSQKDILLPLCLKSFLLRCTTLLPESLPVGRIGLDEGNMELLVPFTDMLARSLMGEALAGSNVPSDAELSLLNSLSTLQLVLDFLVGLASVLHPQHIATLIRKFFKTLRESEITPEHAERTDTKSFVWNEETLRRVRCSRHLRLRSIEHLACLPNFVALNYPIKFSEGAQKPKERTTAWSNQSNEIEVDFHDTSTFCNFPDGHNRVPESGWLASLLAGESLLIASLSCEAVVAEAIAHVETSKLDSPGAGRSDEESSLHKQRLGVHLRRNDLLSLQSTAIHATTCVYELMLRRHAMDTRFQNDQARSRVAALFAPAILDRSLRSTRWLARMEATHKARSIWLLSLVYVLQEAPDVFLRARMRSYCVGPDFYVHRFIRLLRLSSATFQSFIEPPDNDTSETVLPQGLYPWLLQESFNTICAAANMLVEESSGLISVHPREEKKMTQGILDLLLHVLTAPQSTVTLLRTIGGALQTLNKLGVDNFLEISGGTFQHWARVMLTLMNNISLSVRSIAVDFVVSLLGAAFNSKGDIDEIVIILTTILPEVVAREIALYSVNALIKSIEDVESAVWPLRRALGDIEEANPLDDDRVDAQLAPLLSTFCRACQAIIDGVLIELRLTNSELMIVGSKVAVLPHKEYIFDADEESLYEAASFFLAETAPLQRLRWLLTLARLHESKGQWVEAAETLILCAKAISDAFSHAKNIWRPSRFVLWYDARRSLWLSSVGKEIGHPDRGHAQVMQFADGFLEPYTLLEDTTSTASKTAGMRLQQPSLQGMCKILTKVTKQAVANYLKEEGMEDLAEMRLETILQVVVSAISERNGFGLSLGQRTHTKMVEEVAALRRVSASLTKELSKISEHSEETSKSVGKAAGSSPRKSSGSPRSERQRQRQHYVRVLISGQKPQRFIESTTIPTFLEWDNPSICRVPKDVVDSVVSRGLRDQKTIEERICREFGSSLRDTLTEGEGLESTSLMFRTGGNVDEEKHADRSTTYLDVSIVHMDLATANGIRRGTVPATRRSKRFFYRRASSSSEPPPSPPAPGRERPELLPDLASNLVELTVAHPFPCALSRQRTLLTSELLADNPNEL